MLDAACINNLLKCAMFDIEKWTEELKKPSR